MHPFKKYISQFTSLSKEDWTNIEACLTKKHYTANTVLLDTGKICRKLSFLEQGLLRFHTSDINGSDVTKFFTVAPYCFTSTTSFDQQKPSLECIVTLEDSIVWEMNRKDAYTLFRLPSWNEFVRKLLQEVQFNTEQILVANQMTTAEERYRQMIMEESELLSRVPLKYIASYLGIAPQSLSRIRKRYQQRARSH